MTVDIDSSPKFSAYAHPERLVSTDWLAENLDRPGLVVVESDEDVLLYETGHIPGAVKIDWHTDLNDDVTRDYIDGERFAALLGLEGHRPGHDRRHLRRQEQLVGRLRPLGLHAVRPRGRAPARRRPRPLDRRGARDDDGCDHPASPSSTPSSTATTPPSAPSRTTCSPTSATRSSTCAPRRSTAASAQRLPPTPRRARCVPDTSRRRHQCRGHGPPRRTRRSRPAPNSTTSTSARPG